MKLTVKIEDKRVKYVDIDADSYAEAIEKAKDAFNAGEFNLDGCHTDESLKFTDDGSACGEALNAIARHINEQRADNEDAPVCIHVLEAYDKLIQHIRGY